MKITRKEKEHIVSACFLGICILWLVYSRNVSGDTMPGTPGPKFFPFIIVALLAFLTLLKEILDSYQGRAHEKKEAKKDAGKEGELNDTGKKGELRRIVFSFVLIFLYVIGIEVIGFYIATLLAVFITLKGIIGIANWIKVSMATLIITGAVFLIFWVLFKVPLPQGILF